jgi:hypothetical protein
VPTEPTLIDLPSLSNVDEVKVSHKDFYKDKKEEGKAEENINKNLIDQKFSKTKPANRGQLVTCSD